MAGGRLKVHERRNEILRKLRNEGKVSVAQLSNSLRITPVTIRSDLTALEREGYLIRVQGGAVLVDRADENATSQEKTASPVWRRRRLSPNGWQTRFAMETRFLSIPEQPHNALPMHLGAEKA